MHQVKHGIPQLHEDYVYWNDLLIKYLKNCVVIKKKNHLLKKTHKNCLDRGSNTGPLDLKSNALPTELSEKCLNWWLILITCFFILWGFCFVFFCCFSLCGSVVIFCFIFLCYCFDVCIFWMLLWYIQVVNWCSVLFHYLLNITNIEFFIWHKGHWN